MKNKGKLYAIGCFVAIFSILLGGYLLFDKKIEAYAATAVYEGQPYYISFSSALGEASITDGSIYVKDGNEKAVEAIFSLDKARENLTVEGLAVGQYTIYVDKGAFATKIRFKKDHQFDIQVVKQISKLAEIEDLQMYFSTLLNEQYSYGTDSVTTEESSLTENKSDMAMDQSSGSSSRASETNNQVGGIEEGDVIITDGSFIYSLVDDQLVITSAKDPAKLRVVKKLKLGENASPTHLLLHNKTLIVGYSTYMESMKEGYYDGKSVAKFAFYDVTDAANPTLLREIGQDGSLLAVRKSGNILYMISSQTPNYWLLREGVDVELRPFTYDSLADSTALSLDRIHILPNSTEPNYLIVSAVDVSNIEQATVNTQSYLGNSGNMYMSHNAIYTTAMNFNMPASMTTDASRSSISVDRMMPMQSNETIIYKIAVDKTAIDMVAETTVKGSVLNQFSMDEHNGYLRIATTEGETWGTNAESENHLFILDKELKQVGNVSNLARGERIYSARFMGDKAYIVTFKQVDPLFVIDVANPTAPKVLGELKIPGFSNYLHPIGENHLLGIGYDTEVTMQPGEKESRVLTQGMKLSLFNVTDLANPIEQDSVVIGGRGTYSDVQYDHKALFRDVENNLYGFPITIYEPKDDQNLNYKGTGAQLYKVTIDGGIKLAADFVQPPASGEQYEDWNQVIQRLLYIDDALYTISRSQIKSYDLNTFKPISSVDLK